MSYDIYIVDANGESLKVADNQLQGGTYCQGGCTEAWLNVTYNYAKHFMATIDADKGIKSLNGKPVSETIPVIQSAIQALLKCSETFDLNTLRDEDWEWLGGGEKPKHKPVNEGDLLGAVTYWAPTPGNAAKALKGLLDLAFMTNYKGTWKVSC